MEAKLYANSIPVPDETAIRSVFHRNDLADAFSVALPTYASRDPEVLVRFLFGSQPAWVGALMRARDAVMGAFGVKTAKAMQSAPAGEAGKRVGFFRIYAKCDREIVLGEDDRHLDFRLSVMVRQGNAGSGHAEVVIATVVSCHNLLGRIYLSVITPFHKLIVRTTLNRAARAGWPQASFND